ncbi:uncharacterized protein SPPG_02603 [Spizellomyces punctatus DAOM BR117]|uniref:BRO domain-containing protein 1 n=1 Tax=Spizellomyces punctatus (strain DAOM BR117) TaxID=645134 RepID=A0A0L0HMH5_SPIPD|nr:uncharacterized protein SPPG_02603 [Spizellomyces punctatus DAOM BR117]KND02105.1 hypothetical protein SPPG_02603 [Spizellomyces punctatus DAOM BR117]|eukprot:XP_016610144.1 hypothetical protein SPPG_02603 [Spizellomyces punctatus DAOM BR117]
MLRTEQAAIEAVIHPSFSRFFEAPYSEHIPFQDGPNISFNGEVSTFLAVPVKRNDRLLSSQVASGPHPAAPGSFISLLKSKSTNSTTGSSGSIGGLKASAMQYLNFKRALLPSMLALLSRMHVDKDLMQSNTAQRDSTTLEPSNPARMDVQTDPAAPAKLLLSEAGTYLAEEQIGNTGDAEEHLRREAIYTTGLLLPNEAHWYSLNELRIHAGAPERSEVGIERLSHYYAQLLYLEPKFPFETDEIQMNFTWYESLVPDRKVVTNCIQYEKASVLFNIAAVYSILASAQSLWTPDGKRKAAAYFQKGAGVLVYIRDRLCARFKPKLDRASDLNESTLTAAAELMLAQAMECFYEKANDTKASSGVTAKIAAQTADFYEVARRAADAPTELCKARFPKYWSDHIKSKTFMFTAIAHMHTAPQSAADSAVGERIARVSAAKEAVDKAAKYSREVGGALHELVQGHANIINTAYSFLVHANFERHHHPSFDSRLLPPLRRPLESLVIASPLEDAITDPKSFKDIFGAIISAIDQASGPRKPGNDDTRFDGGGNGSHPVPPPRRRGPLPNPVLKDPIVSANEPIATSQSVPQPSQKRCTSPALLRSHLPSMGLANSSDIPPYNPAVVRIPSSSASVELRNFIKASRDAEKKKAEEAEARDADVRRNASKRKGKMPASLGDKDRTPVLHEQTTPIIMEQVQIDNSRIEHWVEEQRRMSIDSGTQPAVVQNIKRTRQQHHMQRIGSDASRLIHTGTQTPPLNMNVETRSRTHYKRIASAAAAAAAAGVSAAFQHEDRDFTEAEHAAPGHSLPRRDPPATVSFDVQGSFNPPAQPTDHKIRRKPSGGYPVPYHAGEGFEPEHGDEYQKEHRRDDNPDVDVIAAAAAEPARRESTGLHHRVVSHGGGRGAGGYKEHNDVLVREFLSGDGVREGSVSQTVEKIEQERRRSVHKPT